jgi:hypothetical protein
MMGESEVMFTTLHESGATYKKREVKTPPARGAISRLGFSRGALSTQHDRRQPSLMAPPEYEYSLSLAGSSSFFVARRPSCRKTGRPTTYSELSRWRFKKIFERSTERQVHSCPGTPVKTRGLMAPRELRRPRMIRRSSTAGSPCTQAALPLIRSGR